jgi:hypothetical protein
MNMNMNRVDMAQMFTVPLFRIQITPWKDIKKTILDTLDSAVYDIDPNGGGFQTDYYNDNDVGNRYEADIYNILKPFISVITKQCFNSDAPKESPTIWSQKYSSNTEHVLHNHGNRGFSFILYLKFDPESHKPTSFMSPFGDFFTGETIQYVPHIQEGDLIAFPSSILHTSQRQNTDKERMILSFNCFPDGFPT